MSTLESTPDRWKTVSQQQIYSMKLIQVLRRTDRHFTVRETADRLLAVSSGGRTRWSRAILSNRLSLNMMNNRRRRRHKKVRVSGEIRMKKKEAFDRKTRVLGELVPGCRKLSFSRLIDEAEDYIAALEMQVRAMSAVAGVLAGAGAGSLPADSDKLGCNN
ncbi:transcription factor bHLH149-like [Impatiens glandulifera]|uniref:transcription factor bHLH149-like n=1 Tax=Impatiens glandulifera TaxID=253017 RepID=UPI001FB06EDB|nr:transcription factor bHLH149-like [Impatiens glandulifera]